MTKRLIAFLLAAMMLCTLTLWVQAEEVSILDRMAEANQLEAMLQNAPRVAFKADIYDAEGNIHSTYDYADGELAVSETEDGISICQNGEVYGFDQIAKRPYRAIFLDNMQEAYDMDPISFVQAEEEKFLTCVEDHGQLVVSTCFDEAWFIESSQEYLMDLGYQATELDRYSCQYILDADTYEIKSYTLFAEFKGGSCIPVLEVTRVEDPQPYEIAQELLDMIFSEDKRTVTVIVDPDAIDETVYSVQVGKGCAVQVYTSAQHPNLYWDRGCTQLFEPTDDYDSDLTVYSICVELDPYYNLYEIQPYPSEDNMVRCDVCGNWYEAGNVFRNHICVPSEIQPYPDEDDLVQCDACGNWYEAGNVFRNHICTIDEIQPYPEEDQCQICGAWYEVGTVHTCG